MTLEIIRPEQIDSCRLLCISQSFLHISSPQSMQMSIWLIFLNNREDSSTVVFSWGKIIILVRLKSRAFQLKCDLLIVASRFISHCKHSNRLGFDYFLEILWLKWLISTSFLVNFLVTSVKELVLYYSPAEPTATLFPSRLGKSRCITMCPWFLALAFTTVACKYFSRLIELE